MNNFNDGAGGMQQTIQILALQEAYRLWHETFNTRKPKKAQAECPTDHPQGLRRKALIALVCSLPVALVILSSFLH